MTEEVKSKPRRHILAKARKVVKLSDTPFIAIDFENNGDIHGLRASFECACAYGKMRVFKTSNKKGERRKMTMEVVDVCRSFNTLDEVHEFLNSLKKFRKVVPCHIVVFNGMYDYPFMREACNDEKLIMGSAFILGETKNGIKIYDIQRHATQGSLGDWMKILNLESFGIIKRDLSDKQARCMDDAAATWHLTMFFVNMYHSMGINMKITMASSALDYFRHQYMEKEDGTPLFFERRREEDGDFARKSYYGGRSEVFNRGLQICSCYDINSTYVSVMANELMPDPSSIRRVKYPNGEWRKHYDNFLGIYDVTIEVPPMQYPPLAFRVKEKLIFPIGTLRGVWTTVDLKAAESRGCKILKCHDYVWYQQSLPLFRGYAMECWINRQKAIAEHKQKKLSGKSPFELFWKTFGNALYGKVAQRVPVNDFCGKLADYHGRLPPGLIPTIEEGIAYVTIPASEYKESDFAFVELSSFISAYARRKLITIIWALEDAGYVTCYVDTDSLKVSTPKQNLTEADIKRIQQIVGVSGELGDWKYEGELDVYICRPKWYTEQTKAGTSTEPPVLDFKGKNSKVKGVGKKATITPIWGKRNGEWVLLQLNSADKLPYKMRESIHLDKSVNFWRAVTKKMMNDDTKRTWFGDESIPLVWSDERQEVIEHDFTNNE